MTIYNKLNNNESIFPTVPKIKFTIPIKINYIKDSINNVIKIIKTKWQNIIL